MAFNCDLLFSYSNKRVYIGGFNFSNLISLQVQRVFDATESTSASPTGMPPLLTGVYTGVVVNGVDFGSGRIVSFSNPTSTDITENGRHLWKQIVNLEVRTTGDASNIGGNSIYAGFSSAYHPQLDSLDESFGFDIPPDGGYQYSHTASVKCLDEPSGAGESGYSIAQRIASGLLATTPQLGYIDAVHSGFYGAVGRRLYNETIDKLNGTANFEEKYSIQNRDFLKHSVNFENGFINITENCSIRHSGISMANNVFDGSNPFSVMTRYSSLMNGAWTRCNSLWNTYSGFVGQDVYASSLASQASQLNKTFDENAQELTYSVTYTNNPNMTASGYSVEREQNLSISPVGIIEVNEQCSIVNYSSKNANLKYFLISGIDAELSGSQERMTTVWSNMASGKKISESKSISTLGKRASYNVVYSSDPSFLNDGTFLTKSFNLQDNGAIMMHSPYFIIGRSSPLMHNPGQTQFGNVSCTVSATLPRPSDFYAASPYKPNTALQKMFLDSLNLVLPAAAIHVPLDLFVSKVSYSYGSNMTAELTTEAQYVYARQDNI